MGKTAPLMLVDDDPDLLRLLTLRLNASGYRIQAVESAEAALAQLAIALPALVITDVRLPGMDGLALFAEIRSRYPALPVILLTAHGTIPDAVEATTQGAFAYLTKPFDGHVLLDKVAQALSPPPPRRPRTKPGAPTSSAAASASMNCWPRRGWWRPPTPASSSGATAAPARNCWPAPSIAPVPEPTSPSLPSIAVPSRSSCWSPNCSAT